MLDMLSVRRPAPCLHYILGPWRFCKSTRSVQDPVGHTLRLAHTMLHDKLGWARTAKRQQQAGSK